MKKLVSIVIILLCIKLGYAQNTDHIPTPTPPTVQITPRLVNPTDTSLRQLFLGYGNGKSDRIVRWPEASRIVLQIGNASYYPLNSNPNNYLSNFSETDPTVPAYAKTINSFGIIKTQTDLLYQLKIAYTPAYAQINPNGLGVNLNNITLPVEGGFYRLDYTSTPIPGAPISTNSLHVMQEGDGARGLRLMAPYEYDRYFLQRGDSPTIGVSAWATAVEIIHSGNIGSGLSFTNGILTATQQSFTETDPTVPTYSKTLNSFSVIKSSTDPLYAPASGSLNYVPYTGATQNLNLGTTYGFLGTYINGGLFPYNSVLSNTIYYNGDSITVGFGSQPQTVYGYPQLVAAATGTNLVNQAYSGTTLVKFTTGDNSAIDRIATLVPAYVSTIQGYVIMYGVNDARNVNGTFTVSAFQSALTSYVNALTTAGFPANKIYMGIPYNNNANNYSIDSLETVFCAANGTVKLPVRANMIAGGGSVLINGDGIHPTPAGQQVIANTVITALGGATYSYSQLNQDLLLAGRLFTTGVYGGSANNGLELHGGTNSIAQRAITLFDPTTVNSSLTLKGNLYGSTYGATATGVTIPQNINLGNQYATGDLNGSNGQLYFFNNAYNIGTSQLGGLGFWAGIGNFITSYQLHNFRTGWNLVASNGVIGSTTIGGTTTPNYIGTPSAQYVTGAAIAGVTTTVFRGYGGAGMGFHQTDGLFFTGAPGLGTTQRITLENDTYLKGLFSAIGNGALGTGTTGGTASPTTLTLGTNYSTTPGANPKLIFYPGYGIGVSSSSMDFIMPTGGTYNYYVNGAVIGSVAATGQITHPFYSTAGVIHNSAAGVFSTSLVQSADLATSLVIPGNPTTTTQTAADNSTKIATDAFVANALSVPGSVTLTAGVATVTITGASTSSKAVTGFLSIGGTVSTTWQYKVALTANTLTITAITNTGTTNTGDTSTLNYSVTK